MRLLEKLRGRWITRVVYAAGGALLLATVLPFLPSNERFVRIWDFPRTQIAVLLALVLMLSLIALRGKPRVALWHMLLLFALAYQAYRMLPFTPLHPVEVVRADAKRGAPAMEPAGAVQSAKAAAHAEGSCERGSQLRLMVANVRQANRNTQSLLRLIDQLSPDLLLLVETDAWWAQQLAPLRDDFANVVSQPQEDTYGMMLFSRLPLIRPKVRFLLHDYVPSIRTGVTLGSGAEIVFHGVHPKPPPLDDTERRDAELLLVAREVRDDSRPSIVAGDLNDVGWSDTSMLLKKVGGLLDPRIGRGLYSTYNAQWPLLRWPLDHVFIERSFTLIDVQRLEPIGSDHFPLFVALCHAPQSAELQKQTPPAEPKEQRQADEQIREGREEAQEAD